MKQDKRLDKLEGSLTPKQAVILWLEEIEQYNSVVELVAYLRTQSESAAPVTRLTRQVEDAVRKEMKGAKDNHVEVAVRKANRDVVFLIKLHHQVNAKVYAEQRAWSLMVVLVAEMQNRMLTEYLIALGRPKGKTSKADAKPQPGLDCKEVAEVLLTELYGFEGAIALIRSRYFDGHQVLFPDAEKLLKDLISTSETLVEMWNDTCYEKRQRSRQVSLSEIRERAKNETTRQTAGLVIMAKSDALECLGDFKGSREEAAKLALS